jgi:hypothetical protein
LILKAPVDLKGGPTGFALIYPLFKLQDFPILGAKPFKLIEET